MAAFGGWAVAVLHALGAPVTPENLRALQAWQQAEGGGASYNPLNTTQPAHGAGNYNSVGVKNYGSAGQGVAATVATLTNGHYGQIVQLLRSGKATAAQIGTAVAQSPWGTGSGVLRVLGAKSVASSSPGGSQTGAQGHTAGTPAAAQALIRQTLRSAGAQILMRSASDTAAGNMGGNTLMQLALARKQAEAARQAYGPNLSQGAAQPKVAIGGHVQFIGDVAGEKASFLRSLQAAVASVGGTKIRVISGYRSPQHNAAAGGVPHSNHTTGDAMDGEAFIPGTGWVPLGTVLRAAAGKYGLRSGDVPGFYRGGPDPNHVDDGFNQH